MQKTGFQSVPVSAFIKKLFCPANMNTTRATTIFSPAISSLATAILVLATTISASADTSHPDILLSDFEGTNYGAWHVTGAAFGTAPARGTLPNQMPVDGFDGHGLANSYVGGDDATGTLTSPAFKVERPYIRFLIGGGGFAGKTCINLLVDGKIVRTATGTNTQSGGSEHLAPAEWDISEFAGQTATLEIVDNAKGGWGHINIDKILQTDQRLPRLLSNVSRQITLEKNWLNLPVKTGAPMRVASLWIDGKPVRQFDIELSDQAPDWWAHLDIREYKGKTAEIRVNQLLENSQALASMDQTDTLKNTQDLYKEPLRPQFHFSPKRGWNNDPNGLIYYQGEYHLFFQHNPYGWNWGNMHWGHAVSKDLVHWEELPIALYPDEHGTMFSGSAVIDWNNTAGFQTGSEKTMICIFTAAGKPFTQGIAYSNDRGRTWTKYDKNPVLSHIAAENRDPKVFWYAPDKKWVMALYLDKNDYALFSSPNLKEWQKLSDITIPDCSECPEFFEIPVDGDKSNTRWIFYGGTGAYLIGKFDGKTFTREAGPFALNSGNCFYASQTYNETPNGRRILVPWGTMATPGMPFNQMMGLPVELQLKSTPEGLRLTVNPVNEFTTLRSQAREISYDLKTGADQTLTNIQSDLFEINVTLAPEPNARVTLNTRGIPITYDAKTQELTCRDRKARLNTVDGKVQLRILVDRTSIDLFGNNGTVYMPMGVIVPQDKPQLTLQTTNGNCTLTGQNYSLTSAWQ
jgi:fructan beta-fructosidase